MAINKTTEIISKKIEVHSLVITRLFDAPIDKVWKAWTDAEYAMKWWGPKGYTSPSAKIDFKVGGKYLLCMRSPEGKDFYSTGIYKEIIPLQRIVSTDCFADEKGNIVYASYYGMGNDFPLELLLSVSFENLDGKTKLTLMHEGIQSGDISEDMIKGWNESLDKLENIIK